MSKCARSRWSSSTSSRLGDLETCLVRRPGESLIIRNKKTAVRLLLAPHQRGCKMKGVGCAEAESLQLYVSLFPDLIGRLDLAPGGQDLAQALFRGTVGGAAELPLGTQALQSAVNFDRRHPPDNWCLLAQQLPSRAACLAGHADVNDGACVPECRHWSPRVRRRWPFGSLFSSWNTSCARQSPKSGRRQTAF